MTQQVMLYQHKVSSCTTNSFSPDTGSASSTKSMNIQNIPDDVLKLIFEEAYSHGPHCWDCPEDKIVIATHVCHRWRCLATDLARLWACLHVPWRPELIAVYIQRAKLQPLSVMCMNDDMLAVAPFKAPDPDVDRAVLLGCFAFLLGFSQRWKRLEIRTGSDIGWCDLLMPALKTSVMPSLEYFLLRWDDMDEDFGFPLCAPLVEFQAEGDCLCDASFSNPSLLSLQIVKLSSCELPTSHLSGLSQAAPHLKELMLEHVELDTDRLQHIVHFPRLTSLTFTPAAHTTCEEIMDCIDAPSLMARSCCIMSRIRATVATTRKNA